MSVSKRLARYVIPYIPSLSIALIAMFVTAWCEIGYVHILSDTIDALKQVSTEGFDEPREVRYFQVENYFQGIAFLIESPEAAFKLVAGILLLMLGLVLLKATLSYLHKYLTSRIRYKVVIRLRREIYHRITFAPLGQIRSERMGDLMSRFIDDVNVIQNAIGATAGMLHACLMVLAVFTMMLIKSWQLTLLTLLVLPSVGYLLSRFGRKIRESSREAQGKMAELASLFQEMVFGLKVVKIFTAEDLELGRFEYQIKSKYRIVMRRVHLMALMTFLLEILSSLAIAAVFAFGCWQVLQGRLSIGWFIGYVTMVGMVFKPVKTLGAFNNVLQQGLASAERAFRLIDLRQEEELDSAEELVDVQGDVEFVGVHFAYDEEPTLQDIHLKAKRGETVALVGPSGAGKTTLLNLIPRFYDVCEGEIRIDGHSLPGVSLRSLREQIALVPQESILFNGTVMENILYGCPQATTEEVIAAARQANAHGFILDLPQQYDTPIGDRGTRLSGGQQQRIAIARAILKNPRILLLDEATSSLDSESEALIQESLARLMKQRTTFVIAHRLSTVVEADQIMVLQDGRIVETGTHQELLAHDGLYARQCQAQLST